MMDQLLRTGLCTLAPVPREMPPVPDIGASEAAHIHDALVALYEADAAAFETFFHRCGERTTWQQDDLPWRGEDAQSLLQALCKQGLVNQLPDGFASAFLIDRWPSGLFHITDRPYSGSHEEVFPAYFEQSVFTAALQVRPGDRVLDLGTGAGILLLESVRRGATGVGIDTNERALAVARMNAAVNGLSDQVRFEFADMCDPHVWNWNRPSVVIANPPFEPACAAGWLPKHSDGGKDGAVVVSSMLDALAQWRHRPAVVQLVLFSLSFSNAQLQGRGSRASTTFDAEALRVWPLLTAVAKRLGASLDLREVASPVLFEDVAVVQHGPIVSRVGDTWLQDLRGRTGDVQPWLHLLLATLLPGARPTPPLAQGWRAARRGDECFVWPTCIPRLTSSEDVYRRYLESVVESRERELEGQVVDLALDQPEIQAFLRKVVLDESMFGAEHSLALFDIRPNGSPAMSACVLHFRPNQQNGTFCQLDQYGAATFLDSNWGFVGATACTVLREQPHLRVSLSSGAPGELTGTWFDLGNALQRFVAVSFWPVGCLSRPRQDAFKNLLSELALQAQYTRLRTDTMAQAIAHEFKNLTQDVAVKARELSSEVRAGVAALPDGMRDSVEVIAIYGRQLNAISLALFELASGTEQRFEASDDAGDLLRAAVRVMLELRARCEPGFTVDDDLGFDDAVELLANTYGRRRGRPRLRSRGLDQLGDLVEITPVVLLLFAAAEPIRNIRAVEPLPGASTAIKTWTAVRREVHEVALLQETTEAAHTPRTPVHSTGAERANRLLPRTFCQIDPFVIPVVGEDNFAPIHGSAKSVVVRRETRFTVHGRPCRDGGDK